ncbi:MerR family transcriptional regulator [Rhodoferax saidenbachensis]|uniref:DNA-binding transcriptional MerR regulator n=1 Tax=Rhodoferax saidenbachensis TaxID=1484693 RepID=A0ABU1ZT44_9BURK|nr:MerR family transcriptional regulator [Rhodoferax saidenbachensis]MDR7308713.1 DNA-binding transcriptional MerR regulator [Rhodoferax saidenbachensis]
MNTFLSIAAASKASGLSAHTLRYYEQIGLIAPIGRSSGARRYNDDDMRWLEFLVRLRSTGMSMRDMQRYAQLLREGQAPDNVAERQAMLEQHALRLEEDQRVLGETLQIIRKKICAYQALQTPAKRA